MSHVSLINEPCLSYPWVMCLLSLCHVSHLHWQQTSLVSFINESCLSYPWVMSLSSSLCIFTVMIVSSNHHCDDRLCHCYDRHSDDTPSLSYHHCDDRLDSVTVMTDTVMSTELLSSLWWQTLYHIGISFESHIYIGISSLWWQRISYTHSDIT